MAVRHSRRHSRFLLGFCVYGPAQLDRMGRTALRGPADGVLVRRLSELSLLQVRRLSELSLLAPAASIAAGIAGSFGGGDGVLAGGSGFV